MNQNKYTKKNRSLWRRNRLLLYKPMMLAFHFKKDVFLQISYQKALANSNNSPKLGNRASNLGEVILF